MAKAFLYIRPLVLSLIVALLAGLTMLQTPQAKADLLDDLVTGMIKAGTHENHKMRTTMNGSFAVEEIGEKWTGTYQVIGGSSIDNRCGLGCKEAHNLTFKLNLSGEDLDPASSYPPPFENFYLTVGINVLSYDQGKDLYIKLNQLDVNATGVPENEKEEYETAMKEVKLVTAPYMNRWLHISQDTLKELSAAEGGEEAAAAMEQLTDDLVNIVETADGKTGRQVLASIMGTLLASLESQWNLTAEEGEAALAASETLMNAKLFRTFNIVSGANAGFQQSILNRFALAETIEKVVQEIDGAGLSEADKQDLADFLNKIRLSFWHRLNDEGLMDVFAAYFEINDIEELGHFDLRYRQQMWDEGKAMVPTKPTEAMSLEEMVEGFSEL